MILETNDEAVLMAKLEQLMRYAYDLGFRRDPEFVPGENTISVDV